MSVDTLIRRAWRLLGDEWWEDTTTASVPDAVTLSVSVTNPAKWGEGNEMEFDDGSGEVAIVASTASGANPVPIRRGHRSTTATSHTVVGTILRKGYTFSYDATSEAIVDTIKEELYPYVWVVKDFVVTPSPTTTTFYPAPADYRKFVGAKQKTTGTITDYVSYGNGGLPIEEDPNYPSAAAGSTFALKFPGGFHNTTNTIKVYYQAAVTSATIEEGDTAGVIVYGALSRLVGAREVPQMIAQKSSQETQVTIGSQVRNGAYYQAQFERKRQRWRASGWGQTGPARKWIT